MQLLSLVVALIVTPLSLAAPHVARGIGAAKIHNNCDFAIIVDAVLPAGSIGTARIDPNTVWTQQKINFGGNGQGVSLKVYPDGGSVDANIAQFEYTMNDNANLVFYDLSLINGNPFGAYPQLLTSNGAGPDISCSPGENPCAAAYTTPNQIATKAAVMTTNLDYHVC